MCYTYSHMSKLNINELMKKALSNFEISDALGGKVNVITYQELAQYPTIEDALGPHGRMVLLYELKEGSGHWICVFRTKGKKPRIEFFDPYGIPIDDQLDYISNRFRQSNNMVFPYLSKLLYECPLPIEYNHYPFQEESPEISTCGRHCIVRLSFDNLSLTKYIKLFKNTKDVTSDQIVTVLTANI
jgi:hypothetical protein